MKLIIGLAGEFVFFIVNRLLLFFYIARHIQFSGLDKMDLFVHLPLEIIRLIQSYSTHDDFHYLLNTSKQSFQDTKKRLIILNLTSTKSEQYLIDNSFRGRVLTVVENGWKQVKLHILGNNKNIWNLSSDIPIHSLSLDRQNVVRLYEMDSLQRLANIEVLSGIWCRNLIPTIPGVKRLGIHKVEGDITNASNLRHLESLELRNSIALIDINSLRDVPNIKLDDCRKMTDFSIFHHTRQKNLALSRCLHLASVESFRMIHHLELKDCQSLEDVSPLHGIHHLVLEQCPKVNDISGLGGHHILHLHICSRDMVGYESLVHIPHIALSANNIVDVSVLRHAKSVILAQCERIVDVSPLANAKIVKIRFCNLIKEVKSLKNVESLTILRGFIKGPLDQDQLNQLKNRQLTLRDVPVKSFSFLQPEVRELFLEESEMLPTILSKEVDHLPQYFRHLQSLTLEYLRIEHVNGLGDIPCLRLRDCYQLVDITALGRNRSVELFSCHSLEEVGSLRTVPIVTIKDCKQIQDYVGSGLENVPRLKIW